MHVPYDPRQLFKHSMPKVPGGSEDAVYKALLVKCCVGVQVRVCVYVSIPFLTHCVCVYHPCSVTTVQFSINQ